ncbi:oxygenase MpaB family protein [Streptomyces sp. NPDC050211]|uniref:oxygenase MpaB family protein n=1 Tax=Streptomyces sp. NPDC050211 TaxID=3154932 RepID=UPI003444DDCB
MTPPNTQPTEAPGIRSQPSAPAADSAAPSPRYTHAALDALRSQGDPLADETVAAMFAAGDVGDVNTLMRFFTTADQKLPPGMPSSAADYLEATRMPPDWVDWDVMERARVFFIDNAAHINTGLSFMSMPATYAIPRVARLLASTHSMDYPSRRMAETGQFVTYLMQPNAFEAGSKFLPAAQKVRLLHAAVRHHLRASDRWDEERDGVPLCQEDMLGGQIAFSLLVLDAMDRMGVHMSQEGAEAYHYAWRVIGAMLGCNTEAAPRDLTEARAYGDLYALRNLGPSDAGVRLNAQLMRMYEDVVPGTLLDPIVPATIRYLVGPTIAEWLEIPRSPFDTVAQAVPVLLGLLETVEDSSPLAEWALDKAGHLLTRFELGALTRGRVMQYAIPEELKSEYGVRSHAARNQRWTPPPPTSVG